jgi:hypothetical protein
LGAAGHGWRRSAIAGCSGVEQRAQASEYQIVDTFGAFRADYKSDPDRFSAYYVVPEPGRHFSELGNRRVAEIVAAALCCSPRTTGHGQGLP